MHSFPGSQAPAIKYSQNGKEKFLGSAESMLRLLGRLYGYYPTDPL